MAFKTKKSIVPELNKRYGPNSFALKTTLSMSDLRSRLFTWVPVSPGVPTAPVVPVAPAVPTAPVVPVDPVDDNDKPLCFCKKVWIDDGRKMVECSNELCEFNRWFHYDCLNLPSRWKTPNEWWCPCCKKN